MVVNITTIHFHYQVVTILGSDVHFNSSDVHYSVFTVYYTKDHHYLEVKVNCSDVHYIVVKVNTFYYTFFILILMW